MSSCKAVFLVICTRMFVVPVYGEPTPLKAAEGNNITLPHNLMGSGSLRWKGNTVLVVTNRSITLRLDDRVLWSSSTGEIRIINLKSNDAGELVLSPKNSTAQAYNLTVDATPPGTPPGNEPSRLVPVVVVVLVLVLAVAVLGYFLYKKAVGCIRPRRNRRSAAGSTPTANGNVENDPMMPSGGGTAETSV